MPRRAAKPSVFSEGCPSRDNLCLLGNKWSLLILQALGGKPHRFTDLHQQVGGISQKMLAQTLRKLEANGLIARHVYPDSPIRIEYSLTPLSQSLTQPISQICHWAEANSRLPSS